MIRDKVTNFIRINIVTISNFLDRKNGFKIFAESV